MSDRRLILHFPLHLFTIFSWWILLIYLFIIYLNLGRGSLYSVHWEEGVYMPGCILTETRSANHESNGIETSRTHNESNT